MARVWIAGSLLRTVIVLETLGLFGIAWGLRRRRVTLPAIGLGRPPYAANYAIGFGIAVGYCTAAALAMPPVLNWAFQPSALKALAIVAAIVAGVFEETLFRGWLMDAVQRRGGGAWAQIIGSGTAFGAAHLVWGFAGQPLGWSLLMPVLWTFVLGLALAALYLKSKRSLGPVIASHIAIDAIIEPGLILAALGHR